jgi:WD40 repeat protein
MYRLFAPILLLLSLPLFGQQTDPVFALNNPEGHYSGIIKVVVMPEGRKAVTLGDDKSICIWDIGQAKLIKKLWLDIGNDEKGRFLDIDIDPNFNRMAVARLNSEGTPVVNLIDLDADRMLGTFDGFTKGLKFVRFDPNSKFIITGAANEFGYEYQEPLRLWKIPLATGEPFLIDQPSAAIDAEPIHNITFYDKGKKLALISFSAKNVSIEIQHDKNALPEYTLKKVKPIITTEGHARYLAAKNQILNVELSGKIQIVDKEEKEKVFYELTNSGKKAVGDTVASNLYVSKSGKKALISLFDWGLGEYSTAIIDFIDQPKVTIYPYHFSSVAFTSDSTFLGANADGLRLVNFLSGEEIVFYKRTEYFSSDPIAFGPRKKIAYDSLKKTFDFENLSLSEDKKVNDFSFAKRSYNGVKIAIAPDGHQPMIDEKKVYYFSNLATLNEFSFLNNGTLLINLSSFNANQSSTLLYDISNESSWKFLKKFSGARSSASGIAPSPDITSDIFVIKDVDGLISLYDEGSTASPTVFNSNQQYYVFKNMRLYYSKKKQEWRLLPNKYYNGKINSQDVLIAINNFKINLDNDLYTYLESVDPSEPLSITLERKKETFSEQVFLITTPLIPPLLSLYESDNEWICWSPEGYYASSVDGEKLGGWVINQGVNQLAEYHPLYDFKKTYYRPELIKLIAREEGFQPAVAMYNREAPVPLVADQAVADNLPPSVRWVSPVSKDTTYGKNAIILQAEVTSASDITNAKVLLNGRTIIRRDQMKVRDKADFRYEVTFEMELLALENTVNLFVENEQGSTVSEERILRSEKIEKGLERYKPNLYILNIGVSQHSIPDYSLTYADKDARAIAELYKSQKGKLFKEVYDRTLTNESATRANILEAFYWLEKNATQKDVVLIFIASHGINEKDKFYILPYDGDPETIRISGVDWLDFSDVLGNLPSKVLVFIDACHSGKLGSNLLASRGQTDLVEAIRALATEENGVVIMAASTGKEYSYESQEWGHGAFTLALLDGLRDGKADLNQDGIINIREIDYFVADRVKELTNGKQHPTTQKPSVVAEFPLLLLDRNSDNRN